MENCLELQRPGYWWSCWAVFLMHQNHATICGLASEHGRCNQWTQEARTLEETIRSGTTYTLADPVRESWYILDEIKEKLQESSGLSVAHSTICVEVHELGLTRQKMSFIMSRRCEDKRAEFLCQVMNVPARMFVFVDETGSNQRDLHREHGYGLHGTTPINLKFQTVNGKRISVIAAMSTNGIDDFYIVETSVNGKILCEYLCNSLLPVLIQQNKFQLYCIS